MSATDTNGFDFYATTDKYGRPVKNFQRGCGDIRAKVVTLPKVAAQNYNGCRYLVNDWTMPEFVPGANGELILNPAKVTHHLTLNAAKAFVLRTVKTDGKHPQH
jgi:hypothetical protein